MIVYAVAVACWLGACLLAYLIRCKEDTSGE